MRGISWLAAKTGQLLKRDSAPWSKYIYIYVISKRMHCSDNLLVLFVHAEVAVTGSID
jgi:hypothetical protein